MAKRKEPITLDHVTLPPLAVSWLLNVEAAGRSANTLRAYSAALRQFFGHLGHDDIESLDGDTIRRWIIAMRKEGYGELSQRIGYRVVRRFLKWCTAEKAIPANPTDNVDPPAVGKVRVIRTLSTDQIRDLLNIPGRDFQSLRDLSILSVLLDTGIRRMECANLSISAVNLSLGTVTVIGKGHGRSRTVPIGVKTRVTVDRYLRARARHNYAHREDIWLGQQGALTYSGYEWVFHRHGLRIGVPGLHPHMLRHTWASRARMAGMSEGNLMILGGWESRDMLDLYGAFEAADRAEEAYRKNSVLDSMR